MTTHVLFDFFGTLVDYSPSRTEQGYARSFALLRTAGSDLDYEAFLSLWSQVSEELDEAARRSHREFSMTDLARAFLRRAVRDHDEALAGELVRTYLSEWNKGVRYLAGVAGLLTRLRERFRLAVVTNTHDSALVPGHLERMGVAPLFDRVVTSVEFGLRKPAPDIFRHALEALDATPERCVYVGDSYEADYLGARAAGIPAWLIDPRRTAPIASGRRLASVFELEARLGVAEDTNRHRGSMHRK